MIPHTDLTTASRIDLTLILLSLTAWLEASCMLAGSHVLADVAARVLTEPERRQNPS
jgi:hypothetical protein